MKTRSLICAASLHAGALALACFVVSTPPELAAPAVATSAELSQTVDAPAEVAPTIERFVDLPRDLAPQADADPVAFNVEDVLPRFSEKPEPTPQGPFSPAPESAPVEPRRARTPTFRRPPRAETAVEKPAPLHVPGAPLKAREVAARPEEWRPPALLEWKPPPDVRRGFKGHVLVVIHLSENGEATDVFIETGTGSKRFDKLLRESFREARFKAATRNGKPIASELRQPIDFQ
ncbi:MAG: TonB family protein [Planctomycetes bacterium]|nr:TonB family protein [Planctomycetota bacterium]